MERKTAEEIKILESLIYYSQISTVENVHPVGLFTHEEAWKKGQDFLNENCDIKETADGSRYRVWKNQFRPAPLPDDLKKWIEGLAPENYDASDYPSCRERKGMKSGATAMYNLLSSKLAEQEKEIERLKGVLFDLVVILKSKSFGKESFGWYKEQMLTKIINALPNSDKNDERSVATEDASSTDADKQKID